MQGFDPSQRFIGNDEEEDSFLIIFATSDECMSTRRPCCQQVTMFFDANGPRAKRDWPRLAGFSRVSVIGGDKRFMQASSIIITRRSRDLKASPSDLPRLFVVTSRVNAARDGGAGERRKAPSVFLPRSTRLRVTPYGARRRRLLNLRTVLPKLSASGFLRSVRLPFQPSRAKLAPCKGSAARRSARGR